MKDGSRALCPTCGATDATPATPALPFTREDIQRMIEVWTNYRKQHLLDVAKVIYDRMSQN
jgi:hypothetical protein